MKRIAPFLALAILSACGGGESHVTAEEKPLLISSGGKTDTSPEPVDPVNTSEE